MKDITLINQLNSLASQFSTTTNKTEAGGFSDMLKNVIADTNKEQIEADRAVEELNTGKAKNIHEVMISMEKADISMRILVQMRNKIVEAYQEIMRMSV